MKITNNVTYTSIVAILVCAKCIKSKVNKTQVSDANIVLLKTLLPNKYIAGTINIPNIVPTILHPKGHIPKALTPNEINHLPRGG